AKQPIVENLPKVGETNTLSKPVTSNSVSTPQESKGVNNDKVIAPGMFRINPDKTSREEKKVPNSVRASNRTKPITVSQPPVFIKKDVNSNLNGLSSTGVDNTKTRRPQPRSNTKHDRVPSASKSSRSKNKEAEVEEHHRNLLLSKNNKHISSACNNIKIDSQDVISKVVCAMCKKCLISVNHDECLPNYVNGKTSRGKKQKAKVSFKENQMKYQPKVTKPKKVGILERLATPKPRKPRFLLRWSPTSKLFDQEGKLIMGTVRFGNDHVAAILGFGDLQWGNILITKVYFVEGLSHNLFSVGQFCDSDLEVTFRRNACFVRNLEGIDLLKGDPRAEGIYPGTLPLYRVEVLDTAPIPTNSSSLATNILITSQDVNEPNSNAIVDGNTFVNPFANSSICAAASSSSQNVDPSNMHTFYQPYPHKFQWTKDHPLEQVIREPSRPVLTRNQLRSDGDMCMYPLSVSTMEQKNVKVAMTDPAWIDSMQEELLQFKRLN
nr:retrovirus-related Pol polyprotein from transposon TNT 1-94 [Tanacetum cinerariifolium]